MTGQSRHSRLVPPVNEQDHSRGPASAPVTLVEYGDYQCPYCGQAYPVIQKLLARMGSKVRFVFRNFPLQEIHPNAQMAAEAAEAAGAQGKFWEMHDRLYEHQKELKQENLIRHAGAIGLDVNRFKEELAEGTYDKRVRDDFFSGVRSGVNGTPTFFINGSRHDGDWDLESLSAAIEAAGSGA